MAEASKTVHELTFAVRLCFDPVPQSLMINPH